MKKLLLILVFLLPITCLGQFQMLDANSIVIINNSTYDVQYELKKNLDMEWQNYSLESNHKITYKIDPGENLYIRLCTKVNEEQKCVSYLLERLKRYQIYWNETNLRWDVAEIKEQ